MKDIYFAHPKIENRQKNLIKKILSIYWNVIDPFAENIGVGYDQIVDFDYALIKTCDCLFAWIPESTHRNIGVVAEIIKAKKLGKMVYCLTYKENPFLDRYCDVIWYDIFSFMDDI